MNEVLDKLLRDTRFDLVHKSGLPMEKTSNSYKRIIPVGEDVGIGYVTVKNGLLEVHFNKNAYSEIYLTFGSGGNSTYADFSRELESRL